MNKAQLLLQDEPVYMKYIHKSGAAIYMSAIGEMSVTGNDLQLLLGVSTNELVNAMVEIFSDSSDLIKFEEKVVDVYKIRVFELLARHFAKKFTIRAAAWVDEFDKYGVHKAIVRSLM
jgi:hypothetical protein